ncbi:C39 family peptidase [Thermomonas sp.]|uniref:C39 family peptidase n=1 Tax=Thermomonas sp. TaxID=1971895 RepID=UPI00391A587E
MRRCVSGVLQLMWLPMLAGIAGHAAGADVGFGAVSPDGVLYTRRVESMQERRFRTLVRQQTDFSCGAAALATILRYAYHVDVDESTVIQGMLGVADPEVVRQRGFSLLDIKRYVERLGMRGRGYRIDESRLRTLRVPGIVLMDVKGFRHFVVLKQVRGDYVELADPILGNRTVPFQDFLASWPLRAVFIVIGNDFDRNTALLSPVERADAKSLFDRQGPLTDAELMDFGFTHSDLF